MSARKISLKSGVFYSLSIILLSSILVFATAWYIHEKRNLNARLSALTERYEAQQKEYLVEEVNKAITIINSIRDFNSDKEDEFVKEEILTILAEIRLRYEGYIFINQLDGRALLFDGKKVEKYKNISDMVDPNGLRIFDIEKEAYQAIDGKFMDYLFKKIDSSTPEPKISYMKGYSDWEWIIGAGTYKNKPTQELISLQEEFFFSFKKNLTLLVVMSFILLLLCFAMVKRIDTKLRQQVSRITSFLNDAATNEALIDTNKLSYKELSRIGVSLNKMITEKRHITKSFIEKDQDIKSIFSAATTIAFVISDMKGKDSIIKEFSPGAENIFGYKQSEIIGKKLSILNPSGDDNKFLQFQNILSQRQEGYQAESKLIKKGGKSFDVFFTTHQLYRPDDEAAMLSVIIDISKRKNAENDLLTLNDALEEKVIKRTGELTEKNKELIEKNQKLEDFNELFVGREFRIKELKNKIEELKNKMK